MMPVRALIPLLGLLLTLVAPSEAQQPTVVQPLPAVALRAGTTPATINLLPVFENPGTLVRVDFRIGTEVKPVRIMLLDFQTPITVTNFLRYTNDGLYADNFVHRSVDDFIIQDGGFRWTSDETFDDVPTFAQIQNEFGVSNTRGTIAMAKLGGNVNSATSQWFINLSDSNADNLDNQNGGFTVFGRVLSGMEVADQINDIPTYNRGVRDNGTVIDDPAFSEIPLTDFVDAEGATLQRAKTVESDVVIERSRLTFTVSSNNPGLVTGSVVGATLSLALPSSGVGSAVITVTATESTGLSQSTTFNVTVRGASEGWQIDSSGGGAITGFSYNAQSQNQPTLAEVDFGAAFVGNPVQRTYELRNRGNTAISGFQVGIVGGSSVFTTSGPVATTLQPNQATTFTVTFRPNDTSARTGTLQLKTTNPQDGFLNVSLRGSGVINEPVVVAGSAYTGALLPASGTLGLPLTSKFKSFGEPAIGNELTLAARGTLTVRTNSTRSVLYGEDASGTGKFYAVQGQSSGIPGAVYSTFKDPVLSPAGKVAFVAKVLGAKATEDEGVWTDLFGVVRPVLREGKEIPSLGGLKLKSITSISLEGESLLALVKLLPAAGTVNTTNDTALLRMTGLETAKVLVRTGALFQISATPLETSKITKINVLQPALYSPGQGRWESGADVVVKLTLADKRTVLARVSAAGVQTKLLQTLKPDAGLNNRVLTGVGFPAVSGPRVSVLGTLGKTSEVTALKDTAILASADGVSYTVAAQEDDAVTGVAGARFSAFADPVLNAQGDVMFRATLRGSVPANGKIGLWKKPANGALLEVVRSGQGATNEDGVVLPDVLFSNITAYALGDEPLSGPLFVATLSGKGTTTATNQGLWMVDSQNRKLLLLRKGADVTLPGETAARKLTSFSLFKSLPGSFGTRRSYSKQAVTVLATFAGGSQAILRIDIPE